MTLLQHQQGMTAALMHGHCGKDVHISCNYVYMLTSYEPVSSTNAVGCICNVIRTHVANRRHSGSKSWSDYGLKSACRRRSRQRKRLLTNWQEVRGHSMGVACMCIAYNAIFCYPSSIRQAPRNENAQALLLSSSHTCH